jgi:hypothetical protein
MRAALLPAGGDPFLLAYWLRHYRTWADEVDELRIVVCGQNDPTVQAYISARVAEVPHASVEFFAGRTDHGAVLRHLVDATSADLVVLCEDDAFVRHPGVIASRFALIERGELDIVGTARGNAGPNLLARAAQLWGEPEQTGSGETGLSLYPCFLFARKADLPANLGASNWKTGEYIECLDYTTTQEEAADTFCEATWFLRHAGLRIRAESAYRSDAAHFGPGRRMVDGGTNTGDAPWFHVGSLSSGYGCSFMVDQQNDGYWRLVEIVRPKGELYDWEKRMSWWTRVADMTQGDLPAFHDAYRASLDQFMHDVEADPAGVARWRANYDPLVTW